eukprot:Opistho-2@15853
MRMFVETDDSNTVVRRICAGNDVNAAADRLLSGDVPIQAATQAMQGLQLQAPHSSAKASAPMPYAHAPAARPHHGHPHPPHTAGLPYVPPTHQTAPLPYMRVARAGPGGATLVGASLLDHQKEEFYRNGFVFVPGVIPIELVNAALRAINHSLGEGINKADWHLNSDRDPPTVAYCKDAANSPQVKALLADTDLWGLCESLIGPGRINGRGHGAQIALRFPQNSPNYGPHWEQHWHVDGIPTPDNGLVPKDRVHSFSLLVGVYLSPIDFPCSGNLCVFPGSHHMMEKFCRDFGPETMVDHGLPKLPVPPPCHVLAGPGDVVLAHYSLAHTVAPNASPHVRYACYFRLSNARRNTPEGRSGYESMTDIWLEFEGMREVVSAMQATGPPPEHSMQYVPYDAKKLAKK